MSMFYVLPWLPARKHFWLMSKKMSKNLVKISLYSCFSPLVASHRSKCDCFSDWKIQSVIVGFEIC